MSQNFIEALHLNEQIYSGGSLLIANQNGNIEGDFVLHYLVSDFIKRFGDRSRVIIALTKDTIGNWTAISSKLGWNLTSQVGQNRVAVLDLPQRVYMNLTCQTQPAGSTPNEERVLNEDNSFNLENILNYCKTKIDEMKHNSTTHIQQYSQKLKFLLVFDDLPTLYYGAIHDYRHNTDSTDNSLQYKLDRNMMVFIQNLLRLNNMDSDDDAAEVSIGALVNSSLNNVANHLARVYSSTLFDISPLNTGYSKLFSGYLTVTRRRQSLSSSCGDAFIKYFQFKLDERNVQFFPLTKTNFL